MKFGLTIDLDNAAFQDLSYVEELKDIFEGLVNSGDFENGRLHDIPLIDSNGNTVGKTFLQSIGGEAWGW